ncbi:hypothetical protein VNO78_03546 [Psophocarpus tetragonolobus]|uniref:Uncharacterized protein n=1 Tax=Psophocarpus tetragonolobus TaxID=3891 RepID=A0AAN9T1B8_PSOTE
MDYGLWGIEAPGIRVCKDEKAIAYASVFNPLMTVLVGIAGSGTEEIEVVVTSRVAEHDKSMCSNDFHSCSKGNIVGKDHDS